MILAQSRIFQRPIWSGLRRSYATGPPIKFTLDQAGLTTDLYVPPRNLPSWFTHPAVRWKALKRRIQTVGINTYMAVKLRREIGRSKFQPLEWKETGLLLYTRMNECFVSRDLNGLAKVTSRWVYGPLSARSQKLPKDTKFDWKIVKLLSRPKVLSLVPLSMPDTPTQYVQAVYRIESRQILSKTKIGSDKVDRVERDVCDNVAFIFDTAKSPTEGRVIGSLFETPVAAPMPDPMLTPTTRTEVMKAMTVRGDIFRPEPEYIAVKRD